MNVELGKLNDGGLVIMCDSPFPHEIRRIEYYREQHLMMLVYDNPTHEGDLMHYELNGIAAQSVESSPSVLVVDHSPDRKLYSYDVPLVQVGI